METFPCISRKNRNASRTVCGPAARGVWPAAGLARSGGTVTALSRARPAAQGRGSSAMLARPGHRAGATDAAAAPRGTHGCVQRVMLDPGNGPGLCIYCAFKSLFRVHFFLFIFLKKARCRTARRRPRVPCPPRVLPAALSLGLDFPSRGLGRARGPRAGAAPRGRVCRGQRRCPHSGEAASRRRSRPASASLSGARPSMQSN